ncbi:hypothetical protein D3C86_2001940 [compost metagenome]
MPFSIVNGCMPEQVFFIGYLQRQNGNMHAVQVTRKSMLLAMNQLNLETMPGLKKTAKEKPM